VDLYSTHTVKTSNALVTLVEAKTGLSWGTV